MAYDSRSNVVYLLVNPSREPTNWYGFRLWASRDKGQTFNPINMDVPGLNTNGNHFIAEADKPMIKVILTNLYVAGSQGNPNPTSVWASHSPNDGTNWDAPHILDTAVNGDVRGTDMQIIPDGTVYFFWLSTSGTSNQVRYAFLSTNNVWSSAANIGAQLVTTNAFNGSGNLLRSSTANTNDYFQDNSFPHVAYAGGYIYIVYTDVPTTTSKDRGDILLVEAEVIWTNHTLLVTAGPRKVNNDGTQTDQWEPSICADPSGSELFIGYYSRQNDPVTNSWIMAYGTKAFITNGLALASFECFPVSPTNFQPLFSGTVAIPTNPVTYEPVWAPAGACLDSNAVYNQPFLGEPNYCPPGLFGPLPDGTTSQYANFGADDYTWCAADANYFYFAWCDRTRIWQTNRPDADIKFAKIRR